MQPTLGIFLARDPWSGRTDKPITLNGFVYASNDPVDRYDPSGLFDLETVARSYDLPESWAPALPAIFRSHHAGWLQLLVDAQMGDIVTLMSYPLGYDKHGFVDCGKDGKILINGMNLDGFLQNWESSQPGSGVGRVNLYALNNTGPFQDGLILLGRNVDFLPSSYTSVRYRGQLSGYYSDWHPIRSLPDFWTIVAGVSVGKGKFSVTGQALGMIDRFGDLYGGVQVGVGPDLSLNPEFPDSPAFGMTVLGGGYIGPAGNTTSVLYEEEMKQALSGLSAQVSADFIVVQATAGTNLRYWFYYIALGAFPQVGLNIGGTYIFDPIDQLKELSWDRFERGISAVEQTSVGSRAKCMCE